MSAPTWVQPMPPPEFAEETEAKKMKVSKAALVGAMARLFDAGVFETSHRRTDRHSYSWWFAMGGYLTCTKTLDPRVDPTLSQPCPPYPHPHSYVGQPPQVRAHPTVLLSKHRVGCTLPARRSVPRRFGGIRPLTARHLFPTLQTAHLAHFIAAFSDWRSRLSTSLKPVATRCNNLIISK